MNPLSGSCHCGTVRWQYKGNDKSVTACNCTLCRRYGALWIYGHKPDDTEVEGDTLHYERGSKTNTFTSVDNADV